MGIFTPKYPAGAAPAKAPKASKPSRREQRDTEAAALTRFCSASTALHRARQDHGWNSPQAKAAAQEFHDAGRD